ncbi:thioredoxin family protein [Lutibacter sp.]|uniref:thioredoxin family protein n=1 Tax=Lutibacter sp. TaxID=1925666 RepID=UPI0025C2F144|nr:thioredoxin family protein [Lutibacter sp.]MCF6180453.1 thioredoxin family protein [Lutibacter sp.]
MKKIIIEESLQKVLSYVEYRTLLKKSLLTKTKQEIENDVFLGYTLLNDKRMDRLDKTLKLSEETINSIQNLTSSFSFLVISEGWCGDSAQVLPILNKIATSSSNIDLKIVFRDENEGLMNQFLTNGSKSIPKVIIVDANNKVINSWGPRPSIATKMVLDYKEKHGVIDAEFKKDLQLWYNKDKGHNTENDILKLLKAS